MKLLGNSWEQFLFSIATAAVVFVTLRLFNKVLARIAGSLVRRTQTDADDAFIKSVSRVHSIVLMLVAVYGSSIFFEYPNFVTTPLGRLALVSVVIQMGCWISALLNKAIPALLDESDVKGALGLLVFLARLLVWSVVILLVLENLGVNISALVAGLGIGGVAVALSVQNILGDILASLSIVLDKPFEVGDFIVVGDLTGTVERIGIKTTRLRSLSGEQLVCSNLDLLSSRIKNFKRMYERRVLFSVGITYQTPRATVERLPGMIREVVEAQAKVRFDRAHFKAFGDSALQFEIVYFVLDPAYNFYMDTQQEINLKIMQLFENEKVEFAYPTHTIFMAQG